MNRSISPIWKWFKRKKAGRRPPFFNHENKILLFSQKVFYGGGLYNSFLEGVGSGFR